MTLLLTIEQGPRPQATPQARLEHGEMVIGRSSSADWQIEDPEMFVSRAHCTVSARDDGYFVTDTSSSGLYIDDAQEPLGAGNTARLRSGMRLRLGEYVIWADVLAAQRQAASEPRTPRTTQTGSPFGDDFFSARTEEPPPPPRPSSLPDPFDFERSAPSSTPERDPDRPRSAAFDDPFSLDPLPTPPPREAPQPKGFDDWGDFPPANGGKKANAHGWDGADPAAADDPPQVPFGFVDRPAEPRPPAPPPPDDWAVPPVARPVEAKPAAAVRPAPVAPPVAVQPVAASTEALRAAFFRGLGLNPADIPNGDPAAEMEKFGREYRLMIEGLMQLLRKRAEEKGNARIAQTVVGASEVNPLKFLPTAEDVLAMMATGRSAGFLQGEPAIADAVQDLAGHHVRAWRGVQTALRRMIDRFDPAAIEEELKTSSALDKLMAGGRSAKLWELYCKRHREISANAESRFLGDVGADFRNAYEQE